MLDRQDSANRTVDRMVPDGERGSGLGGRSHGGELPKCGGLDPVEDELSMSAMHNRPISLAILDMTFASLV
jgi:hypothetical protein